jgi:hypothetical protein
MAQITTREPPQPVGRRRFIGGAFIQGVDRVLTCPVEVAGGVVGHGGFFAAGQGRASQGRMTSGPFGQHTTGLGTYLFYNSGALPGPAPITARMRPQDKEASPRLT